MFIRDLRRKYGVVKTKAGTLLMKKVFYATVLQIEKTRKSTLLVKIKNFFEKRKC